MSNPPHQRYYSEMNPNPNPYQYRYEFAHNKEDNHGNILSNSVDYNWKKNEIINKYYTPLKVNRASLLNPELQDNHREGRYHHYYEPRERNSPNYPQVLTLNNERNSTNQSPPYQEYHNWYSSTHWNKSNFNNQNYINKNINSTINNIDRNINPTPNTDARASNIPTNNDNLNYQVKQFQDRTWSEDTKQKNFMKNDFYTDYTTSYNQSYGKGRPLNSRYERCVLDINPPDKLRLNTETNNDKHNLGLSFARNSPLRYNVSASRWKNLLPNDDPYVPYKNYSDSRYGDQTYHFYLNSPMRGDKENHWKNPPQYYYYPKFNNETRTYQNN